MGKTPLPIVFTPLPRFDTWVDWAKHQYIAGRLTFDEFDEYVDRMFALGDPRWSMLPGGPGPILVEETYGVRDYTFETSVERRAALTKGAA